MLQITERETGGVSVLCLDGKLIVGEPSTRFTQEVTRLVADRKTKIVVDVEDLTFIDSCGIGELIANFTSVRKNGGTLKVAGPKSQVLKVLKLVRLPEVVEVYGAQQEALASFDEA